MAILERRVWKSELRGAERGLTSPAEAARGKGVMDGTPSHAGMSSLLFGRPLDPVLMAASGTPFFAQSMEVP